MSGCKSTAFLDQNNDFYLKWSGTRSYENSTKYFYFDNGICIDHNTNFSTYSVNSFDSDGNCSNYNFENAVYSKTCCECDCPDNPGGIQLISSGDENLLTTTTIAGASTEDPDGVGCENLTGYEDRSTGPGYACPGPSEQNEKVNTKTTVCEYEEEYNSDQNCVDTTIDSSLKATVTWNTSLRLYDSKGDIVAFPWGILPAPDPYDPLNPIRVVSAPACHFFAP
jgi:hypothetical protein